MAKRKFNWIVWIVILSYLVVSVAFWLTSDLIADWAINANPFLVTLVNFITNPFYVGSVILVIELLFRVYKLKREALTYIRVIFASIIFNLSVDIVSILHSYRLDCIIPAQSQVSIYFDTVLGKGICQLFSGMLGSFTLYVLIPVLMAVLALFIASPSRFLGIVKSEVGY